ncbi:hypothetical protein BDW68DRAFT_178921 [Aspergillus falconensis]
MILGLAHISTLRTLNNLGSLFHDQGNLAEAEKTLKQALVGKARLLGPDHLSTLRAKNDLLRLYRDQGRMEEARDISQPALNVPGAEDRDRASNTGMNWDDAEFKQQQTIDTN